MGLSLGAWSANPATAANGVLWRGCKLPPLSMSFSGSSASGSEWVRLGWDAAPRGCKAWRRSVAKQYLLKPNVRGSY